MKKRNKHIGTSFESWLDEEGFRSEVTAAAVKAVVAAQIAREMKRRKISKAAMAKTMGTSRAQVDRLLDPSNGSATLERLVSAAMAVGHSLQVTLAHDSTARTRRIAATAARYRSSRLSNNPKRPARALAS